ncbi:MAG: FKBP-type peptidyl-prolyl cis-trans isomerase [Lachnospiraceae bacterium]|nr:FKBP-type peptidyl-prolyl cis-trans isomerase [Lachnospiraceae bacterium]
MKTVKKIALASVCVALCALMFAGCEKKKTQKEEKIDYSKVVTLSEYKQISLKTDDVDRQVEAQINQILDQNKTYKKVTKGKVADGDTVNIYYVGKIDGEAFDGGSLTKETNPEGYDLTIGSKTFIDGFEESLIGKKIGTTSDITVTFPEQYSANPDLAGKPAVFTVTINSKQGEAIIPEFNDEFVKNNLSNYDSAKAYKEELRQNMVQSMAWDKVMDGCKINEYPKKLVEENKSSLETTLNTYLEQQGSTLDDYLTSMNMTKESYESQKEQTAKDEVEKEVICNAIAEKEKINVSDEDYQEQIKELLTTTNSKDEEELSDKYKSYYGVDAKTLVTKDLLLKKIQEYLAGNVVEE